MTGAVLAGGKSRRMGLNKAFIEVDGVPIIERVLAVMERVFDETLIIADETDLYSGLGAIALPDAVRGAGSLGGIYTALLHARHDEVFVAACDMPDISEAAVRRVIEARRGKALVVAPLVGGRLHPLHALYTKGCLPCMEEMIKKGDLRIGAFLEKVEVMTLLERDFPGIDINASVANMNTREELERLRAAGREKD